MKEIGVQQNIDTKLVSPTDPCMQDAFLRLYQGYRESRDQLHAHELSGEDAATQRQETLFFKELLANLTFAIYLQSESFSNFREVMVDLINNPIIQGSDEETDDPRMPSPIESITATIENLGIIEEFTEVAKTHADGMLFSGSNAWGPFYAVKGERVRNHKPEDQNSQVSDVDLLITAESVDELGLVLLDFVKAGLLDPIETKRFEAFKELYAKRSVDTFWTRGSYKNGQEIHFIPLEVIRKIANLNRVNQDFKTDGRPDFVRVLRPNTPKSVKLFGGYPTIDLKGLGNVHFIPESNKVPISDDPNDEAYLSQMTIGGPAVIGDKRTYFMGVIPFFLLVSPRILIDKDALLSSELSKLRDAIKGITGDDKVVALPREERMSDSMRTRIKNSFKQWD